MKLHEGWLLVAVSTTSIQFTWYKYANCNFHVPSLVYNYQTDEDDQLPHTQEKMANIISTRCVKETFGVI